MNQFGTPDTVLVIIRGNSASGKSSLARALREVRGRGLAWIEQDHLRRILLWEKADKPGGLAPVMIGQVARTALNGGYDAVVEGIMWSVHYDGMLNDLIDEHRGRTVIVYLDVPVDETLRRHATKPLAAHVDEETVRGWYLDRDYLGVDGELILGPDCSLEEMVKRVAAAAGWA